MPNGIDANALDMTSRMKLNINEETGKVTGATAEYADAIQQIYQAKKAEAKVDEKKLELVNKQLEALSSFQTDVTALQTASKAFIPTATYNGSLFIGETSVFSQLATTLTPSLLSGGTVITPASDLLTVDILDTTNLQEFTIVVNQVANYDYSAATTGVASPSAALGWSGTLTLNGQAITITSSMTLNDVNTLINSYSGVTNINSTILMAGTSDYRLSFQAVDLASPMTITDSVTGTTAGNIPAQTSATISSLSASLDFNGIAMTRTTNTITDITNGLTLNLVGADPYTEVTVRTASDTATVTQAIETWVDALNTVLADLKKQQSYNFDTLTVSEDALLYNSDIIKSVNSMINNIRNWVVEGVGANDYHTLDQIGITYDYGSNEYVIDSTTLSTALSANFKGVQKLFDFETTLSNGNFYVTDHPAIVPSSIIADSSGNALTTTITVNKDSSGNITAGITISGGIYAGYTFTVPSSAITTLGDTIVFSGTDAVSGSTTDLPFLDFTFRYAGISNIANSSYDSTTLTMTQGYADQFNGSIANLLIPDTGTSIGAFAAQQETYSNKISSLQKAIDLINSKAEQERKKYEQLFGRLEAARAELLPLLNAAAAFASAFSK